MVLTKPTDIRETVKMGLIISMLFISFLAITGCDEAGMVKPVVPVDNGTEPTDPTTNGEVKQPEELAEPEPTPEHEPTVAIAAAVQEENGSVTVNGTSTDVPEGTTVTVTLGEDVTATAKTDSAGAWTVTVPAADAEVLSDGTVTVTAADTTDDSSFEYTVQTTYGIPTPTEEDRVKVEIVADVVDPDEEGQEQFQQIYGTIDSYYGSLFNLETEVGQQTFKRFAERHYKGIKLERNPPASFDKKLEILDQYFEEAYGISADYGEWLVFNIYLDEKSEDEYLLGIRWQIESIAMEHLLLRIANPNATEEEILELLRESIRAGKVTIASRG